MTEPKRWANQFGSGDMNDKRTSVWGKKLLGGTAGLGLTADQIVELWLNLLSLNSLSSGSSKTYDVYCEPFAGKARTYEALKNIGNGSIIGGEVYLNDLSPHSQEFCQKEFPEAIVTGVSYEKTIQAVDSENTFFMIDPPWRKKIYTNNDFFRCDQSIPQYYNTLLDMVETLKGDWFIASSADEHECRGVLTKSKWNTMIVKSNKKKKIFGKPARTMLCSNLIPDSMNKTEIDY
mgnify:FL=1|tara:strand:- start:5254 stop:5955 length:702 start_codon:yes stop_codon:yes gene_type:complete